MAWFLKSFEQSIGGGFRHRFRILEHDKAARRLKRLP
jgi:hypothetical protein